MALVKCKECGADVSSEAYKCPSCGVQLKKPKRGIFGQIFKYTFILFNILMIFSLIAGLGDAGESINQTANEYEEAGAVIGTAIGTGFLVTIWALGDIILGLFVLFTRPKG